MATVEYPARHYATADGKYLGCFYGAAAPPADAVPVAGPPAPTWKDRRRAAIRGEILGSDGALAEIVEILVVELVARGTAQSTEFATLLAKINDIRAAYPKS